MNTYVHVITTYSIGFSVFVFMFALCRYTQVKSNTSTSGYSVYAFVLEWPENNALKLGAPIATPTTRISMLGYSGVNQQFQYKQRNNGVGLIVKFPFIPPNKLPSFYAWVLKLDNLAN